MSAYVLNRDHFARIANFVRLHGNSGPIGDRWLHVYHPDTQMLTGRTDYYMTATQVANALLTGNLESVAARYREAFADVPVITDRDCGPSAKVPKGVELFGTLRSLRYQSCEVADYDTTLAHATLLAVLWLAGEVAAEQAGAEAWA